MPDAPVSEKAREAAANYARNQIGLSDAAERILAGGMDEHSLVQHHARFEAEIRHGVVEQCAKVADAAALNKLGPTTRAAVSAEIATAIRQLKQPAGGESAIDGGRGGVG